MTTARRVGARLRITIQLEMKAQMRPQTFVCLRLHRARCVHQAGRDLARTVDATGCRQLHAQRLSRVQLRRVLEPGHLNITPTCADVELAHPRRRRGLARSILARRSRRNVCWVTGPRRLHRKTRDFVRDAAIGKWQQGRGLRIVKREQ